MAQVVETTKRTMPPALIALASALLFGASTPAAKALVGDVSPQLLAGVLYLGSGIGLALINAIARRSPTSIHHPSLKAADLPWLAGAVIAGGVGGPLLLMFGLQNTSGGSASLLLNMEAVFTALLAWFAFKENCDRRIVTGMVAIIAGSLVLAWNPAATFTLSTGSLAILAACFCWALDNNLTRNISDASPVSIAAIKGSVAGLINCTIALASGSTLPHLATLLESAVVGFFGYGISLVLFIKALRFLGTARTSAYFSTAPFAGAILSLLFLRESLTPSLGIATAFMLFGVWLHLTEKHEHEHSHPQEEHEHLHSHDEHHTHSHDGDAPAGEPHSHWHRHVALTHSHPHYPDTEHRHDH